jgi:hypothetical protein
MKAIHLVRQRERMWWKLILIALWQSNLSIWLARGMQLGGWGVEEFILITLR